MQGWRGRFGKVCPGDWPHGPEFYPMLPDGVVIVAVTLGIQRLVPEEMERIFNMYLSAAKHLAVQECDVILIAGTPIQTYMGWDRTLEMLRNITEDTGIPATSDLKAAIDALNCLGAKKIVLVSPYEEARNEERKKLLESLGFTVLNMKGLGLQRRIDIEKLPPYASYRLSRQAVFESPDADAIYISCPEWPIVRNIQKIEQDTGKSVIAPKPAILWAALKVLHIKESIKGFGKLLELL